MNKLIPLKIYVVVFSCLHIIGNMGRGSEMSERNSLRKKIL